MNRQVIPSMILSVVIVCLFSIVLYERDKPAALARPSGGEPAAAAASASDSRNVDKPTAASAPAPKGPDTSKVIDEGPQQVIKALAKTERPPSSTSDQHPQVSPAAGLEKASPARLAEAPAVPAVKATDRPGSAPIKVATPSAGPVSSPQERQVSHVSGPAPVSTGHRSAFTSVLEGETLQDVAIRIYGSSDQLDLLWRANRDVLPRKNSPLSAGAVLRTPAE